MGKVREGGKVELEEKREKRRQSKRRERGKKKEEKDGKGEDRERGEERKRKWKGNERRGSVISKKPRGKTVEAGDHSAVLLSFPKNLGKKQLM
jgi:hypothetical protein